MATKARIIRRLKRKHEERERELDEKSVFDPNLQAFEKPKDIITKSAVFSLAFSPTRENQIAASMVNGRIHIYEYRNNKLSNLLVNKKLNKQSTRQVHYSKDGAQLYTCSADKSISIFDIESESEIHKFEMAHNHPVNRLTKYKEELLVSGCDGGIIRLWDIRQRRKVTTFTEHTDFISSFLTLPKKHNLIAASGDGLLSVYDMKKQVMYAVSDNQDDELLSLSKARNDSKIIVGGQSGVAMIFSYDYWGDCSDRLPIFRGNLNEYSLDSCLQLKDDRILIGCSDGTLREVSIFPNRMMSVLGEHSRNLTVEDIKLSTDEKFFATCSYDGKIKFHSTIPIYGDPSAKKQKIKKEQEKDNIMNSNVVDSKEDNELNNNNIVIEENTNNENEGDEGDNKEKEKAKNENTEVDKNKKELKTDHHQFNMGTYQVQRKKIKRHNFFSGF